MKNVPTPELKAVYNGKQRAIIKVSMRIVFLVSVEFLLQYRFYKFLSLLL